MLAWRHLHSQTDRMPWESEDRSSLAAVAKNLELLTTATRINLLYTDEERRELVAQYRKLAQDCSEARAKVHEKGANDGLSSEVGDLVRGEEEAPPVVQPLSAARVALQHASNALDSFRKSHPLIEKLFAGSAAS